ncbi:MAG TPA: hypothetical protein VF721_08260 [Pyrinomonadaceae bacterium]|jgi:hypothetical protein
MKKNLLLIALAVYSSVAPNFAQTKKNTNPSPVSAFAANETGKSPKIKRATEESFGVWNEFSSEKQGFTVVFPAKPEEIWENAQGKFASFETETAKAHYGVMRMKFPPLLDPRQRDILAGNLFAGSFDAEITHLISEKNVCLDGISGKELIYEEAGKIFFTRFYILEQKMFMLSVSLPRAQYTKDFDYWAMKFLDSFGAKKDAKYIS